MSIAFDPANCPDCGTEVTSVVVQPHPEEQSAGGWERYYIYDSNRSLRKPGTVVLSPCGHAVPEARVIATTDEVVTR